MVCMLNKGIDSLTTTSPASEVHNPTYISHFVPCLGTIPLDQLRGRKCISSSSMYANYEVIG